MAKITVQAAAKRLGMDPDSCLKRLQEMGILVRDQLDQIDLDAFKRVKEHLEEEKLRPQSQKDRTSQRIGSRVIRRRRKKTEPAEEAAQPEATEDEVEEVPKETIEEEPAVEEPVLAPAEDIEAPAEAVTGELSVETEAVVSEEVKDETSEPTQKGEETKEPHKRKLAGVKPKRVRLHEVTKEPAKIISKPTIPIEPLKPSAGEKAGSAAKGKSVASAPDGAAQTPSQAPGRGRKGRRVVDFGARGRRKEQDRRESGFLRSRRQRRKKGAKQTEITTPKAIKRKIKITDTIQIGELSKRMGIKAGEVIKKLLSMGMMVTIVEDIDFDTATIVASEFGFETENATIEAEDFLKVEDSNPDDLESRPPVVTVMGHVDHGKTTLLDAIRETDVASGEAGGITQHIGSYSVTLPNGRQITFVDTPGHESFAAMRARGAQVTDIVILMVAADDGVMPQTIESINHAKEAGVSIVVAINKIDKDNANIDRIKRELMEQGLVPEDVGGETLFNLISAKKRIGIDELLDSVLLQAELMDLKADPTTTARAVILDARLERGHGPVANVLIKEGTLRKGDYVVAETHFGRVRMMFDDHGSEMAEALPGMPAQVIGLNGVPHAGQMLNIVTNEKTAKTITSLRSDQARSEVQKKRANIKLEDLYAQIQEGETKELKIVLKGDVQGSVEAVRDALVKLGTEEVKVHVIHNGVGSITETDVNFASASEALIIGFNVRPESKVKRLTERLKVEMKFYNVIYDLTKDIKDAISGMHAPVFKEVGNGIAEVRDTFHISRVGTVAGCYVLEGKILRNSKVRLLRDNVVVYTGNLGSLKRFKDDAKEVQAGFECGMNIDGFNDVKPGDKIESFNVVEIKPET